MSNITVCHRCGSEPVLVKAGAYWRVKCPKHSALPTSAVVGHPMKTQKAAIAEWNRIMAASIGSEREEAGK